MYVDTPEKKFVIEFLDYLIDKKVLKVDSIEGMDAYFQDLTKILKTYQEAKDLEFYAWIKYWVGMNHKNNHNGLFEDCIAESCLSARKTMQELA